MRFSIFSTLFASLALVDGICAANLHGVHAGGRAHNGRELAKRSTENSLAKRFSNIRFTYYAAGLGACGGYNSGSDFIVALSAQNWDGGSHCGAGITITYGGKTAHATIVDECMGCPSWGLDFSVGLFSFFAPLSAGVIEGDWVFGSGDQPKPKPTPTPEPKTTSIWKVTSTSTWSKTTTSTHSASTKASTTSTSTSTSTSASATPTNTGVLAQGNQIMLNFGALVIGGAS